MGSPTHLQKLVSDDKKSYFFDRKNYFFDCFICLIVFICLKSDSFFFDHKIPIFLIGKFFFSVSVSRCVSYSTSTWPVWPVNFHKPNSCVACRNCVSTIIPTKTCPPSLSTRRAPCRNSGSVRTSLVAWIWQWRVSSLPKMSTLNFTNSLVTWLPAW